MSTTMSSKSDPVLYTEGMLYKRQRGLKQGNAKKLKFQERFCRLTSTSLDYYDPNPKKRAEGPKGQFAVEQIKVVEAMKDVFGKEYPYAFQIGDNTEVMYFVAKSLKEMEEWLAACRHVAQDAGNVFLSHHHHGVFGLLNKGRWSCCANPRRACPGCSPSTIDSEPGKDGVTPTKLTPTAKHSPRSSPLTPKTSSSLTRGVSSSLGDSEDSGDEPLPSSTPKIRRFTLADPLSMQENPRKLKEFMSVEKEEEDDDNEPELNDEQLAVKGSKENIFLEEKNIQNSLNDDHHQTVVTQQQQQQQLQNNIECDGEDNDDRHIVTQTSSTATSANKKELLDVSDTGTNNVLEAELVTKCKKRAGASSPCPSIDSGRGTSRPSSQIEVSDLRTSRTESVGKKSALSDQGVFSDEGKQQQQQQQQQQTSAIVEETDNENQKVVQSPSINQDREPSPSPVNNNINAVYHHQRHSGSPDGRNQSRPVSYLEHESSESELSRSVTPQHRKLLANMSTPKMERPRSILLNRSMAPISLDGEPSSQPVLNPLHQACEDGNLQILEEVLNSGEVTDLNELSNTLVPQAPLFIAFKNDHFQIMACLLEHGADPNFEEPREKASLLHWACERGCEDVVDLLIKYKANVNKRDGSGNTPLMAACKNGHLEVVELLLENGAQVDNDSNTQRTALHEAADGGHTDITEILLRQGKIKVTIKDLQDNTPYDIAYSKKNEELMSLLQVAIPQEIRPYSLLVDKENAASQMITSLIFKGADTIITSSRDTQVRYFNVSNLSNLHSIRLTDTILDVSMHGSNHLILGSTSLQLVDGDNPEKRRTVADDTQEDENLLDPPLHLARFGPKGTLVTASVENCLVKVWPPIDENTGHIISPKTTLSVGEDKNSIGCVYCLSVSPNINSPWLAVGLQPGPMLKPEGFKLVYCYNLETRKLHHIFEAGDGGLGIEVCTTFSPDGKSLAIGCSEHLCIWNPKTGDLNQKFSVSSGNSINSICYSPNGAHLAAGLSSGEVQVFDIVSRTAIFLLPPTNNLSPVTTVAYSSSGKFLASGYSNGSLRLWEAYGGTLHTS